MKVLFITSQPLFPPNDGVRIPAVHHYFALAREHSVDCLLLKCGAEPYPAEDVLSTRREVRQLVEIESGSRWWMRGLLDELMLGYPFYGRWHLPSPLPESIRTRKYDLVWCATSPAAAIVAREEVRRQIQAGKYIAGLSDIHSLVLKNQSLREAASPRSLGWFMRKLARAMRARTLGHSENRMLQRYDLFTVQSTRELDWIRKLNAGLAARCLVLSNGVDGSLLSLPLESKEKKLLFVGSLSGIYGQRLVWFIDTVWSGLKEKYPALQLVVVGKGASSSLRKRMVSEGIQYCAFVEDLKEVYRDPAIMVAPIFKGYGIINKVLEAMISGCLVIGDQTAFNGIPDFENGRHGKVANSAGEMLAAIEDALRSPDCERDIRREGRRLIQKHFNWESRYQEISERISRLTER